MGLIDEEMMDTNEEIYLDLKSSKVRKVDGKTIRSADLCKKEDGELKCNGHVKVEEDEQGNMSVHMEYPL